MAGDIHVFMNDAFVATSSIKNVGPSEKFDLYLGIDEDIKVKRNSTTNQQNQSTLKT